MPVVIWNRLPMLQLARVKVAAVDVYDIAKNGAGALRKHCVNVKRVGKDAGQVFVLSFNKSINEGLGRLPWLL